MDVRLPDGTVVKNVPDGTTKADLLAKVAAAKKLDAVKAMPSLDPTDGMSLGEKLAAGAGKSLADTWLGLKQIAGAASQEEIDEAANRDKALMATGGGLVGNIGGQVAQAALPGGLLARAGMLAKAPALTAAGKYLLASPATLGGVATQGLLGGALAGIQPVSSEESRGSNTTLGVLGGAAVPAAGVILRTGKAALEPMYQGGREAIVGRVLNEAAGADAPAVRAQLANAQQLVPGSLPTAGQAAGNAGIAAMERTASAIDPAISNAYAQRMAQQNEARVDALLDLAGSSGARDAAEKVRKKTADALYQKARDIGVDPVMADVLKPQVKNLLERVPTGVMEKARELARVKGESMGMDGSINGLHWMKLAVDDLLSSSKQTGIGKQTKSALTQYQDDLLTVIDDLSPAYATARQKYALMSAPINQMEVAGEIAKRSVRPLDNTLLPSSFARAVADEGLPARATGFSGATFANTMTPGQMSTLAAIKADLGRAEFAKNAGRGVGSDTVQKLAYSNLIESAGMPTWLRNLSATQAVGGIAARGADAIYSRANREIAELMATGLLSPQEASRLMTGALPSPRMQSAARGLLTVGQPAAIGTTTGLLNLQ